MPVLTDPQERKRQRWLWLLALVPVLLLLLAVILAPLFRWQAQFGPVTIEATITDTVLVRYDQGFHYYDSGQIRVWNLHCGDWHWEVQVGK